jgi:adenylate cyclase
MKEIERKFLVNRALFHSTGSKIIMKQGYLSVDPERVVRIRRKADKAWITIKGKMKGITRPEFEYLIPAEDMEELFKMVINSPVEKIRYRMEIEGTHWEVDEFLGENRGLLLAEVELEYENQLFSRPVWLGEEVTYDTRYFNSELSQKPYNTWSASE